MKKSLLAFEYLITQVAVLSVIKARLDLSSDTPSFSEHLSTFNRGNNLSLSKSVMFPYLMVSSHAKKEELFSLFGPYFKIHNHWGIVPQDILDEVLNHADGLSFSKICFEKEMKSCKILESDRFKDVTNNQQLQNYFVEQCPEIDRDEFKKGLEYVSQAIQFLVVHRLRTCFFWNIDEYVLLSCWHKSSSAFNMVHANDLEFIKEIVLLERTELDPSR